jgi:hypothetical protein
MSEVKDIVIQAIDDQFIVVAVNARGHPVWEPGEETLHTLSGLTYQVPIGIQSFENKADALREADRLATKHACDVTNQLKGK